MDKHSGRTSWVWHRPFRAAPAVADHVDYTTLCGEGGSHFRPARVRVCIPHLFSPPPSPPLPRLPPHLCHFIAPCGAAAHPRRSTRRFSPLRLSSHAVIHLPYPPRLRLDAPTLHLLSDLVHPCACVCVFASVQACMSLLAPTTLSHPHIISAKALRITSSFFLLSCVHDPAPPLPLPRF